MNIAVVSQEYPPETAKGGLGTQAYAKASGLARRGHNVHVITRAGSEARPGVTQSDGKRVIRLAGPRLQAHTEVADWIAYSAEVAAEVADLHEKVPLDLIEFPEWGCEAYVHLLNRTRWNRIPTVIQLHGPVVMLSKTVGWPEPESEFCRVASHLEGTCLRLADAVYSSSVCSAQWCAREYGLDAEKIPVLHTGVDTGHFAPRRVDRDQRPTIVFVGKITWNKGVLLLLDAALRVADAWPTLRVRMIGNAEKQVVAELWHRVAAQGRKELLELPGFIGRDALPDELSRADVFAAPSRYEGGPGFVYLEAMSCGLPVIACAGSGASEVIRDGETGFLVPPDDVEALACVLRKLLTDATARRSMGLSARAYALDCADGERCIDALEAFYERVACRERQEAAT
jgi:glycosyltransferase involved in cell wall biosynthesis